MTVLHVVVYTLTQICVSGLAATVATGDTTLNVQVSKGYPRKWNCLQNTIVQLIDWTVPLAIENRFAEDN